MSWQSRIVGRGAEDPEQLLANPRNWRIHPKHQQDAVDTALEQVGWVKTVIVNQRTGAVVDGHLRVGLAISKGVDSVPVTYVDLSEDEERAVVATFDPVAALAEPDDEAYEALVGELGETPVGTDPSNGSGGPQEGAESLVQTLARGLHPSQQGPPRPKPDRGPVVAICPGCGHEWEVGDG